LHDANIPVFGVAGSHDYSSAGKSMLEVLEKAHLFTNVMKGKVSDDGKLQLKFTEWDGVKLTGIIGKRGTLEKKYYEVLDYNALNTEGPKIFVFHSGITEFQPKDLAEIESLPLSYLPKDFDYYAGGHIHYRFENEKVIFPGPLFPNSFKELKDLKNGSFVIAEYVNGVVSTEFVNLKLNVKYFELDATGLSAQQVNEKLHISDVKESIVLIKIFGELEGKISDINFKEIFEDLYTKGAICILRNTSQLNTPKFEEISTIKSTEDVEKEIINDHLNQSNVKTKKNQEEFILDFIRTLNTEKKDGETINDFEERILTEFQLLK
jgi:DNA repair protein SbcD/Mre11